ncbi:cell division regulator GpsB [Bacillus sp. FSL W7-1360]
MGSLDTRLSAKDILDQDFKVGMRGYNQDEVDKFLDAIIQDYEAFQKRITQLEQENEHLRKRSERSSSARVTQSVSPSPTGNTNYDILQRLSNLEKQVFGSKMSELD